ncbi:bile acid:sodium symporter family protein [Variovorax sp. YR216]|uniref:bile acid:sodium symporter family protein n=1 Tax=Variovorax sp. YR216 TaxID=1882828 RepID=UPI000899EADB|nr:hypothetical protein [Variovorax sp. YR216]SEA38951.1 bile acid:Na+ symporter, BASS family [Variovorax sp. YR216]
MSAQEMIVLAMQASVMATVFGFGLTATLDDMLYVVRRPRRFARSFVAMFFVMPIVAIAPDKTFEFRHEIEVALVALALSPVPPLLLKKGGKAGGRASYALGLLVTMAILSLVVLPLGMRLLELVFDRSFALQPVAVIKVILKSIILPLAAGMAVRVLVSATAARFAGPLVTLGNLLLVAVALLVVFNSRNAIMALIGNGTLLAIAVFVVVGLAAGHWLGGPELEDRVVLGLSTASRHPGIALTLASFNYPNEHGVTAAIMLYLLVNIALSMPYVIWQQRRAAATSQSPDPAA